MRFYRHIFKLSWSREVFFPVNVPKTEDHKENEWYILVTLIWKFFFSMSEKKNRQTWRNICNIN